METMARTTTATTTRTASAAPAPSSPAGANATSGLADSDQAGRAVIKVVRLMPLQNRFIPEKLRPSLTTRPILEVTPNRWGRQSNSFAEGAPGTLPKLTASLERMSSFDQTARRADTPLEAPKYSSDDRLCVHGKTGFVILGRSPSCGISDNELPEKIAQVSIDATHTKTMIKLLIDSIKDKARRESRAKRKRKRPERYRTAQSLAFSDDSEAEEDEEAAKPCQVFINNVQWQSYKGDRKALNDGDVIAFLPDQQYAYEVHVEHEVVHATPSGEAATDNVVSSSANSSDSESHLEASNTASIESQGVDSKASAAASPSTVRPVTRGRTKSPRKRRAHATSAVKKQSRTATPKPRFASQSSANSAPLVPVKTEDSKAGEPAISSETANADEDVDSKLPFQPSVTLPPSTIQKLAESVQCSVCLEIQCNSTTLIPCGHSFCFKCSQRLRECPNCRQPILNRVHDRRSENMIGLLAEIPGLLDAEDVKHYKGRLHELARSRERQQKRRRRQTKVRGAASNVPQRFYSFHSANIGGEANPFHDWRQIQQMVNATMPQLGSALSFAPVAAVPAGMMAGGTGGAAGAHGISSTVDLSQPMTGGHSAAASSFLQDIADGTSFFSAATSASASPTMSDGSGATDVAMIDDGHGGAHGNQHGNVARRFAFQPQGSHAPAMLQVDPLPRGSGSAEDAICIDD